MIINLVASLILDVKMVLIAKSGQPDHAGFSRSVDPRSARRQLRVSLSVVGAIAIGMVISVLALRPDAGDGYARQSALSRADTGIRSALRVLRG